MRWNTHPIDRDIRLRAKPYNKGDHCNFPIVNFPFLCSNISAAPGVYISMLMRYSSVCGSYHDFFDRGLLLAINQLNQGLIVIILKSPLRKLYSCHHDVLTITEYLCHKWTRICSVYRDYNPIFSSFMIDQRVCNQSKITGTTRRARTA